MSTPATTADQPPLCVHRLALLDQARDRAAGGDASPKPAVAALQVEADDALTRGPFTIVHKSQRSPSGDPHDYMSLGPYWWPNPATPDGLPYVRRDGEQNPEVNGYDRPILAAMTDTVTTLALANYILADTRYGDHAAVLLRAFFLADPTRMNPHLEFGQAIPGHCQGRGIGIIETMTFATQLIDAIALLAAASRLPPADLAGLRAWFGQYLDWLLTSPHGIAEDREHNNHGTAYDLQVAVFARFAGRDDLARERLAAVPARRLVPHIAPDGRQPHELARTRALSYATMNLRLFFALAEVAAPLGIDLWQYASSDGRSLRRALDWLVPYWTQAQPWPYPQIVPFACDQAHHLLLHAAHAFADPACVQAAARLPLAPATAPRLRSQLLWPVLPAGS